MTANEWAKKALEDFQDSTLHRIGNRSDKFGWISHIQEREACAVIADEECGAGPNTIAQLIRERSP